jgi:hypothetical protein
MIRSKIIGATITLMALTIGGVISVYQMLFDVWMTAYPFAKPHEWRARFYIRLATIIVIGLLWIVLAVWLYRQRRQGREISN